MCLVKMMEKGWGGGGVTVERELRGEGCRRDCGKSDLVRGMRKLAGD